MLHENSTVGFNSTESELFQRELDIPVKNYLSRPSKKIRKKVVHLGFQLASNREPIISEIETLDFMGQILEEIHSGSLVIDDIQDGAYERRGAPSLHAMHGEAAAICLGNWLYFRGMSCLGTYCKTDAQRIKITEAYFNTLELGHRGQILDLNFRTTSPLATVKELVHSTHRLKTGVLMGFGLNCGAITGDATPEICNIVNNAGIALGVALQRYNDIKNITQLKSGKIPSDLKDGKPNYIWCFLQEKHVAGFHNAIKLNKVDELVSFVENLGDVRSLINTVTSSFQEDIEISTRQLSPAEKNRYESELKQILAEVEHGYFKQI